MNSERCIINVACGPASHYRDWQKRLDESLDEVGYDGARMFWSGEYPPGSPTQKDSPYAFKPFAFLAAKTAGHRLVLWLDSAVWARRSLEPVFQLIERQGYLFFYNGYLCGNWITDAALQKQGLTRDEAMAIPDYTGCCMGLDLGNVVGAEFLERLTAAATDGVSFVGDWKNDAGQCSPDPRCRGHRHDQVIGSIIAHRMGLTPIHGADHARVRPGGLFSYWQNDMGQNPPALETVCLVNNRR